MGKGFSGGSRVFVAILLLKALTYCIPQVASFAYIAAN